MTHRFESHVAKMRELIYQKRIRLVCARCKREWRGGHKCEEAA